MGNVENNINISPVNIKSINNDNQISIYLSSNNNINNNINKKQIKTIDDKEQANSYELLSSNSNIEITKTKNKKKKSKKKNYKTYKRSNVGRITYYKNTFKIKSIIGVCLNLFFWIWIILLILDSNHIITFPRASPGRKVDIIYTGVNNDSFLGSFLSTLFSTILHYIIIYHYPEIICLLSYIIYIVYSRYNIRRENFNENNCFLSYNMYIFLVFLTFGEIYKIIVRKYLDI